MYLTSDAHHCKIDNEMQSYKEDEKDKKESLKRQKKSRLPNLLKEMKTDNTLSSVNPNSYKLFYYLVSFSLRTTCIERLFSKMKLWRIFLRQKHKKIFIMITMNTLLMSLNNSIQI